MYSIVDFYASLDCHDNDTDITRRDVDLLQWNIKETEVITKAITEAITKALKQSKKEKTESISESRLTCIATVSKPSRL
jgi:hypothetical protein